MKQRAVLVAAVVLFALAGCGAPAITGSPEASLSPAPPTAQPTQEPPTATAEPTEVPPVGTDITLELPQGDSERGQEVAEGQTKSLHGFVDCVRCHTGVRPSGTTFEAYDELPAIGERGAIRLAEEDYTGAATTPEQYLFESIVQPRVYEVEGVWLDDMPSDYGQKLSNQDLADIIAYLLTLK